ncbi:hypothetical protein [Desulfosudis oleivorans]|uniref:DUF4157 domain-containing protein n=1 Tax=Desulfosudis oleivorans (strain DSM 6200 / JCM 39069 / Hxd3) TaxID=96561 RepID=A9A030_DESOH|nr:hypothetical protein [Desulfosudis oleivorans]ABW67430.1 hypothetical protein Dole_1626 [Desulfosudis oleivorans Hxd3]
MNQFDLIERFRSILPIVEKWIEDTLEKHNADARPVISLPFSRLKAIFPPDLLNKAKSVVVKGMVPFPPLSRMGLPELSSMENMPMVGVTYKDTFFVNHLYQSESLHFHEMVHVVQWERLGIENFLLAYGYGLIQFGYQGSSLEKMAYSLQAKFDNGELPGDIVSIIQQETDAIWDKVYKFIATV